MTFDPALATAGDLSIIRADLEDALGHVRSTWAADTDARLTSVVLGLEALLRAASTLTLVVERVEEQSRTDRRRIGHLNGRVNEMDLVS